MLSDNGFSESDSILRRYGSHCPGASYRNGSFRMNALQTERLVISQSAYMKYYLYSCVVKQSYGCLESDNITS